MGPLSSFKKSQAKNGSKKKKKDADFKKVKLTPGKKIKRLDDTKTNFQSRKIQINEAVSLQTGATKVLLNANLKINSRLKLSAFEKLNSDLYDLNPDNMTGETVNGLAKYLLDQNEKVRTEFIRLVKKCFEILSSRNVNLGPYLQILLIYIKCGLTHINHGVNVDTRKMFIFILNLCNVQEQTKLIDVIYSKMKSGLKHFTNADLELVWLVLKKVQPNLTQNDYSMDQKRVLIWNENGDNCCHLFSDRSYGSNQFDFSFPRFEEQEEVTEDFIQMIDSFIRAEISTRKWNKWVFSRAETKRIRYILELAFLRNFKLPPFKSPVEVFVTDEHTFVSKNIHQNTTNQKEINVFKERIKWLANKLKC